MTTPHDVPASKFIEHLAKYIKENVEQVQPPAWAAVAKTGITRGKTTPRPRLVVHPQRFSTAQSLHPRTHRPGKTPSRLRRKKRLQRQTKPRLQSRRKQHPQNPPTTGSRRTHPNHTPQRQNHDSQRQKTAPRSKRRPAERNGQRQFLNSRSIKANKQCPMKSLTPSAEESSPPINNELPMSRRQAQADKANRSPKRSATQTNPVA